MINKQKLDSMNIRPLGIEDIDAVVAIHVERFPNYRSTSLGKPFLRKMYYWFVTNYPDLALVATFDDQVVGFAVGSIGGYGRRVFRHALPEVAWGFIRHPRLALNPSTFFLWKSYMRAFMPKSKKKRKTSPDEPQIIEAAFASLAASESAPGAGIALILAFERAAKRKGARLIGHTVRRDNLIARRLYESLGWQLRGENLVGASYYKRF